MNFLPDFATAASGFLMTYLIHSSVIIASIALALRASKRLQQPRLRTLAYKSAILLPLLTTMAVNLFPFPHVGFRFAVWESRSQDMPAETFGAFSSYESSAVSSTLEVADAPDDLAWLADEVPVSHPTPPRQSANNVSPIEWKTIPLWITGIWLALVLVGIVRLWAQINCLRKLRNRAVRVASPGLEAALDRLRQKMGVRREVELLSSGEINGAFTAGFWRPYILVTAYRDEVDLNGKVSDEWEALLAHELAHIAHRDAEWNLLTQIVHRLFPIQPMNRIVCRQLHVAMDFAADESAARVLGEQQGLIRCLIGMGDRLFDRRVLSWTRSGLATGMVAFRSTLGRRVERLLDFGPMGAQTGLATQLTTLTLLTMLALTIAAIAPHVIPSHQINDSSNRPRMTQVNNMKSQLSALAVLIGLTTPAVADEPQVIKGTGQQAAALKATPDELPKGIRRFNGMLVGRLAAKDVEKGTFVVVVDAIPRVWRNSKAENPKSILGKSVRIDGVFGKFLDVLVTTRVGETLEFECKHDGDALVFPGELLRKVAAYKAEDYPTLPEAFRGFRGALIATIKKKDPETFELIIEAQKVKDVWKENGAKQPESIVGKSMMLAGFWNRKDAYHKLKVGDTIEVGMQHIGRQSEHLTVAEFVRGSSPVAMREGEPSGEAMSKGVQGFKGMLVGRLVKKDVERGTFTVTVDAVPRVWRNNKSANPKALIGKNVDAEEVPSRLLDALVVTRIGETLQFGALSDDGNSVRVGEVLRKVAPVKKGDYPELPDAFRGFSGILKGKVVKKNEHLWELTVKITDVVKTFPKDKSRDAQSIIDKQVMLSGFWNRKDAYHSFSVGDKIQVGVEHPERLGDQLSVIEGVRKLED